MSSHQMTARTSRQVLFPGQAAAPDGPCDLLPMFLMHHAFRRDLGVFCTAVAATPLEDRATWRALEVRWQRFARILHLHHEGEDDVLWPLLAARVDVGNCAVLQAMEAEHDEIDPLLARCAEGFARLASAPDADSRAALVVRLAAAGGRLGAHLGHEEADAMALVQRHLTQQEWHALDKDFAKHYRPSDALFALPWVLHDVPADVWPQVSAFVGRPMVTVWRLGLRGRFERAERRAFRHVPQATHHASSARWLLVALGVVIATGVVGWASRRRRWQVDAPGRRGARAPRCVPALGGLGLLRRSTGPR